MKTCTWCLTSSPQTLPFLCYLSLLLIDTQLPRFTYTLWSILANNLSYRPTLALTAPITRNHEMHLILTIWTIPTLILCLDMCAGRFDHMVSGMPKSHLAFESWIPIHEVIQQGHEKPCQNTTSYLSLTIKNMSMNWTAALFTSNWNQLHIIMLYWLRFQ